MSMQDGFASLFYVATSLPRRCGLDPTPLETATDSMRKVDGHWQQGSLWATSATYKNYHDMRANNGSSKPSHQKPVLRSFHIPAADASSPDGGIEQVHAAWSIFLNAGFTCLGHVHFQPMNHNTSRRFHDHSHLKTRNTAKTDARIR